MGAGVCFLALLLLAALAVVIAGIVTQDQRCTRKRRSRRRGCRRSCVSTGFRGGPVYGEFVNTFTLGAEDDVGLPIVQPGASLVFPIPTVPPVNVSYVDDVDQVGLLVPNGTYDVFWTLNPGDGANVSLLVNGVAPETAATPAFPYAQQVVSETGGILSAHYLVNAPLDDNNLISLVNSGDALFTLDNIPNTAVGSTAIVTQIRVERLGSAS